MRRHAIFCNYRRYYSHHAIVVTTIVTTVVIENRMPTHAIFILMSDARCRAPFLRKNRPSWTTTTMMQRSVQRSLAQKSGEPSDEERAFSCICHRCRFSRNILGAHGVLSRHRNLRNRVSHKRWFRGNAIVVTEIVHNSAL